MLTLLTILFYVHDLYTTVVIQKMVVSETNKTLKSPLNQKWGDIARFLVTNNSFFKLGQ